MNHGLKLISAATVMMFMLSANSFCADAEPLAVTKWSKKLPTGSAQRLVFTDESGLAAVKRCANTKCSVRIYDGAGNLKFERQGNFDKVSSDGKFAVGSDGVMDLSTGRLVWKKMLSSAEDTGEVLVSPSAKYIAILPAYEAGQAPNTPFLRVYSRSGQLIKDFGNDLRALMGKNPTACAYYGQFAEDDQLVVYLQTRSSAQMVFIDIPAQAIKRTVPAPAGGDVMPPVIVAAQEGVVFSLDQKKSTPGQKRPARQICAYSYTGEQRWCKEGDFSRFLHVSKSGRLIATSFEYQLMDTQLLDGMKGDVLWKKDGIGEALYLSDDDDSVITVNDLQVNVVGKDGQVFRALRLPGQIAAQRGSRDSWVGRYSFDPDRHVLSFVLPDAISAIQVDLKKP